MANTVHHDAERLIASVEILADQLTPRRPQDRHAAACSGPELGAAIYEELGFTDASEIKDRFYFHSMYVRSPGGIPSIDLAWLV